MSREQRFQGKYSQTGKLQSEIKDIKGKINGIENKMEKCEQDQRKCNLIVK